MRKCRKCGKEFKLKSWSHVLTDFVCLRCLAVSNYIAPVQEYEVKGEDKMQTKHIEKLEELIGEKWGYKNGYFKIEKGSLDDAIDLYQKNFKFITGEVGNIMIRPISLKNLSELEFYGLKVILNEKPKLSREDKGFLSREIYFARERDGRLYFYYGKPHASSCGYWEVGESLFTQIDEKLFPFITWESGKAWSKAELMELGGLENEKIK